MLIFMYISDSVKASLMINRANRQIRDDSVNEKS